MGLIRFKTLKWGNVFSYGPDNELHLDKNPITQLVGKNGHGKSSIALILEEVLFNKNSKGIKKANILNRYSKSKSYSISLDFESGNDTYTISTVRGTTQTVVLTKNGEDISAHTSTGTYKLVEDILGYDHKTFTQIVYQSNPFSLEFLTSTDTARKKFLIDLLNLTKYSELGDTFKEMSKEVSKTLEVSEMKLKTVNGWLDSFSKKDVSLKTQIPVPAALYEIETEIAKIQQQIININDINSKILKNNKYKDLLNSVELVIPEPAKYNLTDISVRLSELEKEYSKFDKIIKGTGPVYTHCPSCGQAVDNSHKAKLLEEAKNALAPLQQKIADTNAEQIAAKAELAQIEKAKQSQLDWEKYHALIDSSVPTELMDAKKLENDKNVLTAKLQQNQQEIDRAVKYNAEVLAHNARSEMLLSQKDEMLSEQKKYVEEVASLSDKANTLQILSKTFSPSGLVAYKIEVLVKDLENITNKYLQDMSGGRFQLTFRINNSDKLDVVITDNGKDIEILALSNGELARVNISTLLAIRKLMQSISDSKTNMLILDETIDHLDPDGKEKLIEILLQEEHLNTFLVSHGFQHPLLEKVNIIKTNNISRIE